MFTLEVARDDPRLFDEVLNWLLVNESLLSVRRLHAMCRDTDDERLLSAVLGWLARNRPRARLRPRAIPERSGAPEPLFRGLAAPVLDPDPDFIAYGLLRPPPAVTGKAGAPQMRAPVNLAFRLRQLLGVGVRAEVIRHLLTTDAPVSLEALAGSAAFTKRNVQEALSALHTAGVVSNLAAGGTQRYVTAPDGWRGLLEIGAGELAVHRDWPQLLRGLRLLHRWLISQDLTDQSEYMLSSQARDLLETVRPDFEYVGIPVGETPGSGAWRDVQVLVDRVLRVLDLAMPTAEDRSGEQSRSAASIHIHADTAGSHHWRIVAPNGNVLAVSPESFPSREGARRSAELARGERLVYEIYVDSAGHFRWRGKAPNGKVLVSSGEAFVARSSAVDAAEHAADLMSDGLYVQ